MSSVNRDSIIYKEVVLIVNLVFDELMSQGLEITICHGSDKYYEVLKLVIKGHLHLSIQLFLKMILRAHLVVDVTNMAFDFVLVQIGLHDLFVALVLNEVKLCIQKEYRVPSCMFRGVKRVHDYFLSVNLKD